MHWCWHWRLPDAFTYWSSSLATRSCPIYHGSKRWPWFFGVLESSGMTAICCLFDFISQKHVQMIVTVMACIPAGLAPAHVVWIQYRSVLFAALSFMGCFGAKTQKPTKCFGSASETQGKIVQNKHMTMQKKVF